MQLEGFSPMGFPLRARRLTDTSGIDWLLGDDRARLAVRTQAALDDIAALGRVQAIDRRPMSPASAAPSPEPAYPQHARRPSMAPR